jgi:hypothetical protein
MPNAALSQLLDRIAADGAVTAQEALEIRRAVFPDGVIDRAEAEALFQLAGKVANEDAAWRAAFIEAIGDHVLVAGGHLGDQDGKWLLAQQPDAAQSPLSPLPALLLVDVLRRAETAPDFVVQKARALLAAVLAQGPIGVEETQWVRTLLNAPAAGDGVSINAEEARWLFAIEAAGASHTHHPAWGDLFVKALLNHVMGLRASNLLTREAELSRRTWLQTPHRVSPRGFLARAFSGGLAGFFEALCVPDQDKEILAYYDTRALQLAEDEVLTQAEVASLLASVRADGVVTANEARLMEEVRLLEAKGAAQFT